MRDAVILTRKVTGLPYRVGDHVPVCRGKKGLVWHVWNKVIELPKDSYEIPPKKKEG